MPPDDTRPSTFHDVHGVVFDVPRHRVFVTDRSDHRETGSAKLVSREHQQAVQMIAFNKGGDLIATGGGDTDRAVRIWRLSDWSLVRKIETPGETKSGFMTLCCGSAVQGLAFTEDGTAITAALRNGAIYTWLIQTGAVLQSDLSRSSISAASGLPSILVIAPGDGKLVQILESRTLMLRRTLSGSSGTITAIGVDASGTVIAAGDDRGNTTIWTVRTGKRLGTYQSEGSVNAVALSSDAMRLIVGGEDQNTKLWNVQNGVLVFDLLKELGITRQ
jgi:WD40 repeat protein